MSSRMFMGLKALLCVVTTFLTFALATKTNAQCSYIDHYSSISLPRSPSRIIMVNDTIAVVSQRADSLGVTILDLADPANPYVLSTIDTIAPVYNAVVTITAEGNYLYVGTEERAFYDSSSGSWVISGGMIKEYDISNPANPIEVKGIDVTGGTIRLAVSNRVVYATIRDANFNTGIAAVDFNVNPPVETHDLWSYNSALAIATTDVVLDTSGRYAYVAAGDSGLLIYDNSQVISTGPVSIVSIASAMGKGRPLWLSVQDDRLFVTATDSATGTSYSLYYDISNPASPIQLKVDGATIWSGKLSDRFVFWLDNPSGYSTINAKDTSVYLNTMPFDVIGKETFTGPGVFRDFQYVGNYLFAVLELPPIYMDTTPIYLYPDSLFVLRFTGIPRPPVIVSPDTVHVNEGQNVSFDVLSYDPDECTTVLDTIGSHPANMTIVSGSRSDSLRVSFNPDWTQAGTYNITFRATDMNDTSYYTVTIIAHDRTPMFAQPVDYDFGYTFGHPWGIATGDLDGDGDIDLVETEDQWVSSTPYNFLRIMSNDSTGLFTTTTLDTLPYVPIAPVLADLNGDTLPDIIYSFYDFTNAPDYDTVTVLINNGNGTFAPPALYQSGRGMKVLHAFDADGDGDTDIAAYAFRDTTIVLLFNNGNGTFGAPAPFTVVGQPQAIATGDIDGDGDEDMVLPVRRLFPFTDELQILRNDGTGTFTADTAYPSSTSAFNAAIGDVDNDGDNDIVAVYDGGGSSGNQNGRVSVMFNDGTGSFPTITDYTSTRYMKHVALADVDNDGTLDILVGSTYFSGSNQSEGAFQVLQNNGDGTFQAPVKYPTQADIRGLQAADVDNDGDIDGIVADIGIHGIQVLMNNTLLSNHPPTFQTLTPGLFSVIEGDTLQVVIQTSDVDGQFPSLSASGLPSGATLTDNGDGTATLQFVPGANQAGRYQISLFASDGLAVTQQDIELIVYNGDGLFNPPGNYTLSGTPTDMAIADVNMDGAADVAVATSQPNAVEVWTNDGAAGMQLLGSSGLAYTPDAIVAADFDGDLDNDLAVTFDSADVTHLLTNNGSGSFAAPTGFPHGGTAMVAADFDLDNDVDLAVSRPDSTSGVYLFKNDSTGNFAPGIWYSAGTRPVDMVGADFDANGSIDLAVADAATGHVWVLLSNSSGFAAAVPFAAGQLLAHLASGDLDSDGDIDIVTSSAVTDTLAILLNNGDGTFTSGWQGDLGYHAHGLTIASLKAGDSVSIIGVGSAFNGGYYVTAVAHQMSGGTYQLADSTDLYWCGGWPVAIGSARLDADNDEDLVILQKQAGRLTILSGTSDVPVAVGDDDGPLVPLSYTLGQNYPNPFNPTTRIRFTLPHATSVQLQVFNILGQRVTSLVDDELPAGEHVVTWDGTNRAGKRVASGIYFYRLVTGDFVQTKKMLLLK